MCRSVQLKSSFYVLASGLLLPTVFKLFSLLTLAWNGNGQLDSFLKVRERSYSCKQESLYIYIYIIVLKQPTCGDFGWEPTSEQSAFTIVCVWILKYCHLNQVRNTSDVQ